MRAKLRALVKEAEVGITAAPGYTVGDAVTDWLNHGLTNRDPATVAKLRHLTERHLIPHLGARRLKDLSVADVEAWLQRLRDDLATNTLQITRSALSRAVRRAQQRDLVLRNVVELTEVPRGREGRRSKALTAGQADAILKDTLPDPLHPYIVVSLLTGARTEELRALRWEHTHLDADTPLLEVWRSVRSGGDTKTRKSRRTLALPQRCVDVLTLHAETQRRQRVDAGAHWTETGLVFTTSVGTAMDAANIRRSFRRALALVDGINPEDWTPRELRHSFVSLLSDARVPIEEISRLVGHSGTTVTELVYRHQPRPVIQTGATVMDRLFSA